MMEVTSCGELERQTPEGDTGNPLGDLCAKLRHWPKPGSPGEQVKPTWLHSSIAMTVCLVNGWIVRREDLLCVVQHHVRQRSVRETPSPSWHTHTPHMYTCICTLTCKLTHCTHTYKHPQHTTQTMKYTISERLFSLHPIYMYTRMHTLTQTHMHTHKHTCIHTPHTHQ